MVNVEYRKLGGAGTQKNSLTIPKNFYDLLKWKSGDYIIIECDEFHQQLVLRKAKDHQM